TGATVVSAGSSLGVLRRATGLVQTHLLALDGPVVAGNETGLAQRRAQRLVVFHQGAGDTVANGAGLAGGATSGDRDVGIQVVVTLHELQWLKNNHARRFPPG